MKDTKRKDSEDYYLEDGKVIFTEKYLKERGACCQNGCRHCPYGFKKDKPKETQK